MKKHLMLQISQIGHASQSVRSRKVRRQEELKCRPGSQNGRMFAQSRVSLRKTLPVLTSRTTADVVLTVRPGHEMGGERL